AGAGLPLLRRAQRSRDGRRARVRRGDREVPTVASAAPAPPIAGRGWHRAGRRSGRTGGDPRWLTGSDRSATRTWSWRSGPWAATRSAPPEPGPAFAAAVRERLRSVPAPSVPRARVLRFPVGRSSRRVVVIALAAVLALAAVATAATLGVRGIRIVFEPS